MTPDETALVLAKCVAFDRRTVGRADVLAWHEVLNGLELADALAAVTAHYSRTRDWVMPSDVLEHARTIARDRRREVRLAREADQARAIGALPQPQPLRDRTAAVRALVRQVIDALPVTESERRHQRAVTMARSLKGRPEKLPVRPKGKHKVKDWPPPQTDDVAALATRYLLDEHDPAAVAERLCISRKWCQKTATRFATDPEGASTP